MLNKFRSRRIGIEGYRTAFFCKHVDGYLAWMVDQGYARMTLHGYLGHLRAFAAFQKAKRISLRLPENFGPVAA